MALRDNELEAIFQAELDRKVEWSGMGQSLTSPAVPEIHENREPSEADIAMKEAEEYGIDWNGDNVRANLALLDREGRPIKGGPVDPVEIVTAIEGDEFINVAFDAENNKAALSIEPEYSPWIVELTGTSGTLTDDNLTKLTTSSTAQIVISGAHYYKADEQTGYTVFVHADNTDGSDVATDAVYVYTDSTEQSYKHWDKVTVNVLPITADKIDPESGNLGKFLHAGTSGTNWANLAAADIHAPAGSEGKTVVIDANNLGTLGYVPGVSYKDNATVQANPLKFVKCTQAQYNALTPDNDTFYIIVG